MMTYAAILNFVFMKQKIINVIDYACRLKSMEVNLDNRRIEVRFEPMTFPFLVYCF